MIRPTEAYKSANEKKKKKGLVVIACRELDDSYVFMTNYKDEEDIYPGSPIIQVMKANGVVDYFDETFKNDPYEKIDMLNAAKEIDIDELKGLHG